MLLALGWELRAFPAGCFGSRVVFADAVLTWKGVEMDRARNLRRVFAVVALLITGTFILAVGAQAASVYNCSASGEKCVVKVEAGIIGDHVKVLDEKARVIATGRIIKRRGAYAVVAVSNKLQTIRKGYPVIVDVENRDSNLQWAASFSSKD